MRTSRTKEKKILRAIAAGIGVWLAAFSAELALVPIDRTVISRHIIATSIGGLVAVIVTLSMQLKHEELHAQVAMDRAAIVAELNHHVRNAIFPMNMAVQSLGDEAAKKMADEAVERINIALKDATTDALSRRVDYSFRDHSNETPA